MAGIDLVHTLDKIIQVAAETAARDIQDRMPAGAQKVGIHQVFALLVGDDADLLSLADKFIRRRKEWDDLPIIMLSSEATDTQVDQALALGADAYTFKPATIEDLESAIERATRKRKSGQD